MIKFSTEIFGDYSYGEIYDKINNFVILVKSIDSAYNRSENMFLNIIEHYCDFNLSSYLRCLKSVWRADCRAGK